MALGSLLALVYFGGSTTLLLLLLVMAGVPEGVAAVVALVGSIVLPWLLEGTRRLTVA